MESNRGLCDCPPDTRGNACNGSCKPAHDPVNHPRHYTQYAGVECIDVAEQMSFNLGNAIKYIWRAPDKGNIIQDLKKARWYLDREIERLEKL